jgi:hypothetical protein
MATNGCASFVALVGAIVIGTTACGGGGKASDAQRPPAIATTTTAADPRAAERAAVQAAFGEYRRFYVEVVANPNPANPALPAHLTGDALGAMQRDQLGFQSTHEGKRFSDETDRSVIVSIDPGGSRAVVDECVAAIAHYFDTRTGQPMGAPPSTAPTSEGFEFVFVKEAGTWKVAEKHTKPSACP